MIKVERGCLWTLKQTKALLSIWGNNEIQQELQNSRRNTPCFIKVSEMLREHNVYRTAKQCQRKIKALKLEYRKAINHNRTNKDDVKSCQFFQELDNILGTKDCASNGNVGENLSTRDIIKDSSASLSLQALNSAEISEGEENAPTIPKRLCERITTENSYDSSELKAFTPRILRTNPSCNQPSELWMLQGVEDSQASSQILLVPNESIKGTPFTTLGMGHSSNFTPGTKEIATCNTPKERIIEKQQASTQTLDTFQAKGRIIANYYEKLSAQKIEEHELVMKQNEEEHSLKLEILNEKLKLFKSINKKIENGRQIHLCINQFD